MSLALPEMPESTLITLGLSSGAPDSCGFPHHSHMAPSTPFYYLICSLSSPPLTLFCQASHSSETTPASNRSALGSAASLGRIPVRILILRTKSVCLDRKTLRMQRLGKVTGKLTRYGINYTDVQSRYPSRNSRRRLSEKIKAI